MGKIKGLKIQIRSAQHVGKVWISRKKSSRPYLGPSEAIFFHGPNKCKNMHSILPIFLGGPMGPIHPVWGHMLVSFDLSDVSYLLSTLGGDACIS